MGLLVSGKNPAALKTAQRLSFVATAGQTVFTIPNGYSVGDIDVYMNGIRLVDSDDFFAIDGSTITLVSPALVGDHIHVMFFNQFVVGGSYSKSETDARYMSVSGLSAMTGYLKTPNYGISSTSDTQSASLEASSLGSGIQGVGIKAWGRSMPSSGGELTYITDTRGASGQHIFYGWNGSSLTQQMKIDNAGRVTKPLQPAWAAEFPGFTCSTASTVYSPAYGTPVLNTGGNFNTSTGIFTVQVAGTYLLMASFLRASTAYVFRGRFYRNGLSILAGEMRTTEAFNGYNESCSHVQLMPASVGDQIKFGISCDTAGGSIYSGGYNFFCGYLLG